MKYVELILLLRMLGISLNCALGIEEPAFSLQKDYMGVSGYPRLVGSFLALLCVLRMLWLLSSRAKEYLQKNVSQNTPPITKIFVPVGLAVIFVYGISTIGQLASCKQEMLEALMGKMGNQLYEYANGLDEDPVRSRYDAEPVKSVGNGTTFPQNLTTREQVVGGITMLADSVATRLRHQGLYAGGVQVTLRDPEFKDRSRQKQLSAPTHLIRDLTEAAMELVRELWKPPAPIRALTVTAIHLVPEGEAYEQVDLFTAAPKKEKQEKLEGAMDAIRRKYGDRSIVFGAVKPEKEEDPFS